MNENLKLSFFVNLTTSHETIEISQDAIIDVELRYPIAYQPDRDAMLDNLLRPQGVSTILPFTLSKMISEKLSEDGAKTTHEKITYHLEPLLPGNYALTLLNVVFVADVGIELANQEVELLSPIAFVNVVMPKVAAFDIIGAEAPLLEQLEREPIELKPSIRAKVMAGNPAYYSHLFEKNHFPWYPLGMVALFCCDGVMDSKCSDSEERDSIDIPTEVIGDIFAIHNNYTLGLTEEAIISTMRSLTSKLIMEEKYARASIQQLQNVEIIDKVSRALGILRYSYQIKPDEALDAISLCKLGLEMGWISGISEGELNQLFFNCRRAHLLSQYPTKTCIHQEEIPHKRAEFIHQALNNTKLVV